MSSGRSLADGKLPSARNVLYTVPDGMVATISWISVYNTDGSAATATFFVRRQGEVRRFARQSLDSGGGHGRIIDRDESLVLAEGDAIEGSSGTDDVVEYTISGTEERADAP